MPHLGTLLLLLSLLMPVASQALADGMLHLGVFPRRPAADTQRLFEPLAEYLGKRLNQAVALHTPADHPSFWHAVEQERYDLVHYNQYHYIRAHRQFGHELVAKNEEQGKTALRAGLFVRWDSPYASPQDLRDRKILFGGDRSAMVSYILATDLLREAGLGPDDYLERFAQNPFKAAIALHYRQADAAAAGEHITSLPVITNAIGADALRPIAFSIAVPHLPWSVSSRVSPARRAEIRDALLSLNDATDGRRILRRMALSSIRAAEDAEYDGVRQVVERVLGRNY